MIGAPAALAQLWHPAGGDPAALERATLTGADPLLPTDFKIGTAASAVIAATALAATELWRLRTGRGQSVSVDLRAAVAAFRSERYLRVDGQVPPDPRGGIFGFYRTGDGRWVQLHGALPHHREGIVRFLGCDGTREAAAAAGGGGGAGRGGGEGGGGRGGAGPRGGRGGPRAAALPDRQDRRLAAGARGRRLAPALRG